jgi:DNA-binding IclR family transcriptional regulator
MVSKYSTPALEKGLDILELLSEVTSGLTQKEIANALEKKPSEIFRMIVCLEERSYIKMISGSERYQLTLKMFDLANRQSPVKKLVESALPIMNQLASDTNQSCHVAAYNSDQIIVVAQVDSPHVFNFSVRIGTKIDALNGSSGTMLLAFSDQEKRKLVLKTVDAEQTALLNKVAVEGICLNPSTIVKGVTNLSCPIFDNYGDIIAALTIPYIDKSDDNIVDLNEAIRQLKRSAQAVSKQMGSGC